MPANKVIEELAPAEWTRSWTTGKCQSYPIRGIVYPTSCRSQCIPLAFRPRFEPPFPPPENPALRHFVLPKNLELAWRRYIAFNVWCPIIRSGPRFGKYTLYLPFDGWRLPFTPDFKCFYGDQWFTGSHKAAEIFLNPAVNICSSAAISIHEMMFPTSAITKRFWLIRPVSGFQKQRDDLSIGLKVRAVLKGERTQKSWVWMICRR